MARKVLEEPSENVVAKAKKERAARRNPFSVVVLFLKQVFAELRKVVTPTRRELVNYTIVVLVFVLIVMAIVTGLDVLLGFLQGVVFGHGAQ